MNVPKNIKLSLILIFAACSYTARVQGMNWTGKEKIHYLLNNKKEVISYLEAGFPAAEELANVRGKELFKCIPFSGLPEQNKEKLHAAFHEAREDLKKKTVTLVQFDTVEQKFKIKPFLQENGDKMFLLTMALRRLTQEKVNEPCTICSSEDFN